MNFHPWELLKWTSLTRHLRSQDAPRMRQNAPYLKKNSVGEPPHPPLFTTTVSPFKWSTLSGQPAGSAPVSDHTNYTFKIKVILNTGD